MKKTLIASMLCVVALPVILCGCGTTPLKDSPTQTAQTVINGSALTYKNDNETKYIYFANSYIDASSTTSSYDAKLTALNRIKLDENGKIVKDDNGLPTQQEQVVQKIVGSSASFMFSKGDYIYFASPSRDVDVDTGETKYDCNQYYRIKTDGTGQKLFYSSSSAISQQSILTIDNKDYLLLVDDSKLIKVDLSSLTTTTLAEDFTSAIFADKYVTSGDQIAYYTKDVPSEQTSTKKGNLLYAVDVLTGENLGGKNSDNENLAINETNTRTITLKEVFNGNLYFTFKDIVGQTETTTYYAYANANNFTYNNRITSLSNLSEFEVVMLDNGANTINYVYVDDDTSKTYVKSDGQLGQVLIDYEVDIFFTYGDYVYFAYSDTSNGEGIYRISVQDKEVETITTVSDYKTTNMSFDGQYLYYFAKNTDNTTGTYYMHRSQVGLLDADAELLSILDDDDKPDTEEDE